MFSAMVPENRKGSWSTIPTVDKDPPFRGVVEARYQTRYRSLTSPRRSDEGYRHAGLDPEVHVVQDGAAGVVCEGHVFERDAARSWTEHRGVLWVLRLGLFVEDVVDALGSCDRSLGLRVDLGGELYRTEELLDVDQERGKDADRERAGEDEIATVAYDQRGSQGREHVYGRGEG